MFDQFREIWLLDFEFFCPPGQRPTPLCLVAREYRTDELLRVWLDDPAGPVSCPFSIGPQSLIVAYYASAEFGCMLALDWKLPERVVDLFVEFRNIVNGRPTPCGNGLLGALTWFGLGSIEAAEKDTMRALAMRGGPYGADERLALLDYCQTDVDALARLLPRVAPRMNIGQSLLRGRYMKAVAAMEFHGVPIDVSTLEALGEHWDVIRARLIQSVDADYGVFEGTTFKSDRWAQYLSVNGIPWSRLESGRLALDDETFRQMARRYPREVGPMRELRHTLGQMRLKELPVGSDGRNRCLLSPFRSRTGRNQPSNSQFIFGPSAWLRSLITPDHGRALAYIDWSQQEFAIAGALSGDAAMCSAYTSGDPYLTFAKQAGAVPPDATKQTHPHERGQFKVCALAVQYGMSAGSLAAILGEPEIVGRELLRLHRQTYRKYWRWSQGAIDHAMIFRRLSTVFGWNLFVGLDPNPRSLANFPCQANGAEMLRLACCLIVERGVRLLAPIHDAVLIEADVKDIDEAVRTTQTAMQDAGRIVLDGFELRTDADVVRYPERYADERGARMWDRVCDILAELCGIDPRQHEHPYPGQTGTPTRGRLAPLPGANWHRYRGRNDTPAQSPKESCGRVCLNIESRPSELDAYRLPENHRLVSRAPVQRSLRRQKGLFIRGPIPLSWLTPVLTMRGRGPLAVALALYHQAGLERSDTVRMTEKLRERFHVNKRTASRALARMESAGLIQVIRRPGCCHVVEILRHQ